MLKNKYNTYFQMLNTTFHTQLIVILISLVASFSTNTYAVWHQATAKPLLIVREAPDAKSRKLGNIRYGSKVNVLETTNKHDSSRGKPGNWVKIEWQNSYAYVFDVYLTQLKDKPKDTISKVTATPDRSEDTESKKENEKTVANPKVVNSDNTVALINPNDNNESVPEAAKKTASNDTFAEPTLRKGAPACRSEKSMKDVVGIAREDIPLNQLPYDCKKLRKSIPLRNITQHEGLIRIEIVNRGRIQLYWTSPKYIAN